MRTFLLFFALTCAAPAAQGQPKPPAHFPGSKGAKANVYAAQAAESQARHSPPASTALPAAPNRHSPPAAADRADPPDVPKVSTFDRPFERRPATAAAVAGSLEKLEGETQKALALLAEQLDGLADDRRTFADLDKTVETAKRVNAVLLARCEALAGAGQGLSAALGKLKRALADAPKVYRQMAADRRSKALAAVYEKERDSWSDQAEMCDAAAALCEKRYAQLFSAPVSGQRSFALDIDDSLAGVRRMADVHAGWKEVLDTFPTTAQGDRVDATLAKLSTYVEDLNSYGGKMRALTEAMRAKADELPPPPKK